MVNPIDIGAYKLHYIYGLYFKDVIGGWIFKHEAFISGGAHISVSELLTSVRCPIRKDSEEPQTSWFTTLIIYIQVWGSLVDMNS